MKINGEIIKNFREELEITQEEMAAKLYMDVRSYRDFETGKREIRNCLESPE